MDRSEADYEFVFDGDKEYRSMIMVATAGGTPL
jgi:hypothetical protein